MDWVKVDDESELKPGMTVKLTGCGACGRDHGFVLFGERQRSGYHTVDGRRVLCPGKGWTHSGLCKKGGELVLCLHNAISDGRCFRRNVGPLARTNEELSEDVRVALRGLKKAASR
jgi:hypothetical protein